MPSPRSILAALAVLALPSASFAQDCLQPTLLLDSVGVNLMKINDVGQVMYSRTLTPGTLAVHHPNTGEVLLGQGFGLAINNKGQIVGHGRNPGSTGFLYLPEPDYGLPAGFNVVGPNSGYRAEDINESGQIVLQFGEKNAWVWQNGSLTALQFPPQCRSSTRFASAIGNQGVVAGSCRDTVEVWKIWLIRWNSPGSMGQIVGDLGGIAVFPVVDEVNDRGEILGEGGTPDTTTIIAPFLWLPEAAHGLPAGLNFLPMLPGHDRGFAGGFNNHGQVVFRSHLWPNNNSWRGVLWERGTVSNLNTRTCGFINTLDDAMDINEYGQIVAERTVFSPSRYYRLDPPPNVVALEGGVRLTATIPNDRATPLPDVWVNGVPARDVAVVPLDASTHKLYFTPPAYEGAPFAEGDGFVDVAVYNGGGPKDTLTLFDFVEYTNSAARGAAGTFRQLTFAYEELLPEPGFATNAVKPGAIAEVILHGIMDRAEMEEAAPVGSVMENALPALADYIEGNKPKGATFYAHVKPATYGQTLHKPVRPSPTTVLLSLGPGTLEVGSDPTPPDTPLLYGGEAIPGGVIRASGYERAVSFVEGRSWSFFARIDPNTPGEEGLQLQDVRATPVDLSEEVARRLSVPRVLVTGSADQKLDERMSYLYVNPDVTAKPFDDDDTVLDEWFIASMYRLNLDGSDHVENFEKPALVVRQSYALAGPHNDFEPLHCLVAAHAFPRTQVTVSSPEGTGTGVSAFRADHRFALSPQRIGASDEYLMGAFGDLDDVQYWFPISPAPLDFCVPVPIWLNIFDPARTSAPVARETLFTDEQTDNVHLHHDHAGVGLNPFTLEPLVEAPGSFDGTIHMHWRWGQDYGARFGSGAKLMPLGQSWTIGVIDNTNDVSPLDPLPDFASHIQSRINGGTNGIVTFGEKGVWVGCEQTGVTSNRQYETLSPGFAFALGPTGIDCEIADFMAKGIPLLSGATVGLGGYAFAQLGFGDPSLAHLLDAFYWTYTSLGLIDLACSPPGGGHHGAGAPVSARTGSSGQPACGDLLFPDSLVGHTTPLTVAAGAATVVLSAGGASQPWTVGANVFGSALGFNLTSAFGAANSRLDLAFTPAVRSVRDLPIALNLTSGTDSMDIAVFLGATPLGTLRVGATAGTRGRYAETLAQIDVGQPFDRLEIAPRNPVRQLSIGHARVCSDAYLAGDLNLDGVRSFADFALLDSCTTGSGTPASYSCASADLDADGDVDCADVLILVTGEPSLAYLAQDCDSNGVANGCEGAAESSPDSDGNGAPDVCGPVSVDPAPELPLESRLHAALPNPSRHDVRLRLDMSQAGRTVVQVLDVSGRLVRTLVDGSLPAGRHALAWNGRHGDDSPAPAGIYFVRARAPGFEATRRIVRLARP